MAMLVIVAVCSLPCKAENAADDGIHEGACIRKAGTRTVTFDITPKPVRHMQELLFSVKVEPGNDLPDRMLLDLGMPGMQMGKNQVTLLRTKNGAWQGKGIIVRCMSGRKLWKATVRSSELHNTAFTFNVRD
jgi:hypothetical protein